MARMTSREFNQDVGRAKRAALDGPVIITERGQPSHVLLTFEEFRRISGTGKNIIDLLAMPGIGDIELEIPKSDELARGAEFS